MYKKEVAINDALLMLQEINHNYLVSNSVYSSSINVKDGFLILKFTCRTKLEDES